jgi:hypothetical protein
MPDTQPKYVLDAMRGLTKVQRQFVIDGCFHGDVTMATVRALQSRALFYLKIISPNGRCGSMVLTPLGKTVQTILSGKLPPSQAATADQNGGSSNA